MPLPLPTNPFKGHAGLPPAESAARDRFRFRVVTVAVVTLGAVFLATALWVGHTALVIVYVSALIAIGLTPFVNRIARLLGRRGQPASKSTAAFLVYLVGLMIFAGVMALIVPAIAEQFRQLSRDLPDMFTRLQRTLVEHGLLKRPVTLEATLQTASSDPTPATPERALVGMMGGMVGFITVFFLSYYFVVEGSAIVTWLLRFVPAARRSMFMSIACGVSDRVAAWLSANVVLGAIMGTTSAVFLGLVGAPFFFVIAVLAAVGEAVPVAGSFVAGVIAVGLSATKSIELATMVAVFFFCLHEVEANILVPRIMKKRVGVSSAALIVALVVGFEIGGLTGIIVAVPTAAIIAAVLDVTAPETGETVVPHTR